MRHIENNAQSSYALLTPPGQGGIATIQISGNLCHLFLNKYFCPKKNSINLTVPGIVQYGVLKNQDESIDEVVLVLLDAKTDLFHLHCHGGSQSVEKIQALLKRENFHNSYQTSWLQDHVSGDSSLMQIEELLVHCKSLRGVQLLLSQRQGVFHREIKRIIDTFNNDRSHALQLVNEILSRSSSALALISPPPICFIGNANAGKSTLCNAIMNEERIVTSSVPGTTRDPVHYSTLYQGWPLELYDTAGFVNPKDEIDVLSQHMRDELLKDNSYMCVVIDGLIPIHTQIEQLPSFDTYTNHCYALNKIDHKDCISIEECKKKIPHSSVFPVSAINKQGCEALCKHVIHAIYHDVDVFAPNVWLKQQHDILCHISTCMQKINNDKDSVHKEILDSLNALLI